ncbi:hypothetical protein P170DRAFT_480069 [Aspergillus steynii IBT 23096]|uniref:Uncharacterized protein n=1 Tax=Aspergillus steynii IBT 23096 TaxID=1392250 RepID=A0A2I2FUH8_9EURO|nr:uncharacterized protein P170DRAFT_480069 [Aspergillus steynii IBT 23096]PLB44305.1 hypothetical protein P170DRAFT_480069 [Aspergillus steynii IBT 23096]
MPLPSALSLAPVASVEALAGVERRCTTGTRLATQNAVKLDKDEDLPMYMKDFLEQLIRKLNDPNSNIDPKMKEQLKMDIQELMEAFGAKTAAELPGVMLGKNQDLFRALAMVAHEFKRYVSIKNLGAVSKLLQKVVETSKNKFPDLSRIIGKYTKPLFGVITVLGQGVNLYYWISYLMNWKDLTDAERARAVLNIIESVLFALVGLKDLYSTLKEAFGRNPDNPDTQEVRDAVQNLQDGIMPEGELRLEVPDPANPDTTIDVVNVEELAEVNTEHSGSTIEQVGESVSSPAATEKAMARFSWSAAQEVVIGGINAAANIASMICLGFQVAEEIQQGNYPTALIVLDIANMCALGAQVIFGVAETVMAIFSIELACIPFLGAVAAAIGVIIMIISMIWPRPPPENPIVTWANKNFGFIDNDLDDKPVPALTYDVSPTQIPQSQRPIVSLTISNNTGSEQFVKQIQLRFEASAQKTALFKKPTPKNKDKPAVDPITGDIFGSDSKFASLIPGVPDPSTNLMACRISPDPKKNPKDEKVGLKHGESLIFTLQGSTNSQAGTASLTVTEILQGTADHIPDTDVWKVYKVRVV